MKFKSTFSYDFKIIVKLKGSFTTKTFSYGSRFKQKTQDLRNIKNEYITYA